VIPFAVLIIGPPVVFLTSIALIAGFLLLLTAAVCPPLEPPFAWATQWCLAGSSGLVHFSESLPGSYVYCGAVPHWWLWVFYAGLLAALTQGPIRRCWRWAALAGLAWLGIGLLSVTIGLPADELRCTFLAVGHGGCIVLETPDGRTLLYDAGALGGPNVTRRQIAPYLWHRGIRRIDEVFLSHADLDHFNGLTALLDRFLVGQVTHTPTFPDKQAPGVQHTLAEIDRHRIPRRVVCAGDRLSGGEVELHVLHPPPDGPEGNENARSLVLLIRHAGQTLLLTGDLEGPGLERVLKLPAVPIDVLMAPHHGSRFPNTPELAQWARPKLVISCEGPPRGPTRPAEPYSAIGARFLGTWPHGAIAP
jgi:competence protein ComEC